MSASHGDGTDDAVSDVLGAGRQAISHQIHLTGDQVLKGRASAAVEDVGDAGAGLLVEQLTRQMVRGTVACRAVIQLTGARAAWCSRAWDVWPPEIGVK